MKITDEEIKRDTLTCKTATPGPWRREDIQTLNLSWMEAEDCDDQEFISQARTRWPLYIKELKELREELKDAKAKAIENFESCARRSYEKELIKIEELQKENEVLKPKVQQLKFLVEVLFGDIEEYVDWADAQCNHIETMLLQRAVEDAKKELAKKF